MSQHPDVYARVFQEVRSIDLDVENFTSEMGNEALPLLTSCIYESMRLRPPVISTPIRILPEDMQIGKFFIPKDVRVMTFTTMMHRLPEFWKDPDTFDPERFNKEEARSSPAYVPFSYGRRNCIGKNMAMFEMQLVLYMLLREVAVPVDASKPVQVVNRPPVVQPSCVFVIPLSLIHI